MTIPLPSPYIVKPDGSADADGVQRNFETLAQTFPVNAPNSAYPVVTALPTGSNIPNGMVIYYLADDTNGVVWMLKYRSASASSFKWEYIGGPPLYSEVNSPQQTRLNVAYGDLATVGPSVTVPLAGDYDVNHGAAVAADTANAHAYQSYAIGGTAANDANSCEVRAPSSGGAPYASVSMLRRHAPLTAATALICKYRADAGTGFYDRRWMRVTPVRVG